jgi:hypothetical protein
MLTNADALFCDGFDKYGLPGSSGADIWSRMLGEWTAIGPNATVNALSLVPALNGTGYALRVNIGGGTTNSYFYRNTGNNYARTIGGRAFSSQLSAPVGWFFLDNGNVQFTIFIEVTGKISVWTGSRAALIATSTIAITAGSGHIIEWDITFSSGAGKVSIWLDGVLTSINLTGVNTQGGSGNAYYNEQGFSGGSTGTADWRQDHQYDGFYLASGGPDTPILAQTLVATDWPAADVTVQFTPAVGILGEFYTTVYSNNAPGANTLFLRKFVPLVDATLDSVSILPEATSAGAKFKAVAYADNGNTPTGGALLSSGTEVVGCTAGQVLTGDLVTPQALVAATPVWIGFITDTSIALLEVDGSLTGEGAANSYAGGAPGTGPAMTTGLPSWIIFGLCTSMAANWPQVTNGFNNVPEGLYNYNTDDTVGHQDLFSFPFLSGSPQNVYFTAMKVNVSNSLGGARTIDVNLKSGATTSAGSSPGQSPPLTWIWAASYFKLDPNGDIAWTPSNLNAADGGYSIAS